MHAVRSRAHILLSFLVRPSSLMRCCAFLSCFAVLASTFLSCSEQPFLCSLPVIRLVALRMYSRVSHALRLCAFRWRAGSLAAHRAGCLARSASASRSLWYVGPYCCAAGSFRIMCVCEEPALFNKHCLVACLRALSDASAAALPRQARCWQQGLRTGCHDLSGIRLQAGTILETATAATYEFVAHKKKKGKKRPPVAAP